MGIVPDYGDTPLSGDELDSLLPRVAELLGVNPDKMALYDLEQAIHVTVAQELMTDVLSGHLSVDAIVTSRFIRDLHRELYGEIWTWAGVFRRHEINLGSAPELIPTEITKASTRSISGGGTRQTGPPISVELECMRRFFEFTPSPTAMGELHGSWQT